MKQCQNSEFFWISVKIDQVQNLVFQKILQISPSAFKEKYRPMYPLKLWVWPNLNFYARIGIKTHPNFNQFQPLTELQFSELFPKVWNAVNPKPLGICPNFQNITWRTLFPLQYLFLPISKFYLKFESIFSLNFVKFLGLNWF